MVAQPMVHVGRSYTPGRLPRPGSESGELSREQRMSELLKCEGPKVGITPLEWESDTFWFSNRGKSKHPGVGDGYTPDCPVRLDFLGGIIVYLEFTEADEYLHITQLPPRVRAKNRRRSRSRKAHILPSQYVAYKREKMALAEEEHEIKTVLLPAMLQDEILADITKLGELIGQKLVNPAMLDAYIDQRLAEREAELLSAA